MEIANEKLPLLKESEQFIMDLCEKFEDYKFLDKEEEEIVNSPKEIQDKLDFLIEPDNKYKEILLKIKEMLKHIS